MQLRSLATLLALLPAAGVAHAEVRLPHALSDHAVLQRSAPIHLWGWATPGAHLKASFHKQTIATAADQYGAFSLYLEPEPAGGPYTLTLSGDGPDKLVTDLLVGDVWFASGQSNMEMPLAGFPPGASLRDSASEIAAATNPRLRLLLVERKASDFPLNDIASGDWTTCTPATAAGFSAIAYFFGRAIAAKENVPIGLIDSTWGGTPADSWVSLDTFGRSPQLLPAIAARAQFAAPYATHDATVAAEKREDAAAKAAGKPAPAHPWHPDPTSWSPAGLYNGMIAPFAPLSIKGFLWYQGETNSAPERARFYSTLFPALITDWREHFAQGDLPFLYVQISSFHSPNENWGLVRDAQRRALALANTAMAVSLDVGDPANVHPPDKQTVASRLALAARSLVYGEPGAYTPPLFRQATRSSGDDGSSTIKVWFDHADGLTTHGKPLTGFELAGADHRFVAAEAKLDGASVLVHSAAVPDPVYVRYGWSGVVDNNLFNAAALPVSTFTSEPAPER